MARSKAISRKEIMAFQELKEKRKAAKSAALLPELEKKEGEEDSEETEMSNISFILGQVGAPSSEDSPFNPSAVVGLTNGMLKQSNMKSVLDATGKKVKDKDSLVGQIIEIAGSVEQDCDKDAGFEGRTSATASYGLLIKLLDQYINGHNPWTKMGKQRLAIMKAFRWQANEERKLITPRGTGNTVRDAMLSQVDIARNMAMAKIDNHKIGERKIDGLYLKQMDNNMKASYSITRDPWVKKEWIQKGEIPEEELSKKIEENYKIMYDRDVPEDVKSMLIARANSKFKTAIMATKSFEETYYGLEDKNLAENPELGKRYSEASQGGINRDIRNTIFYLDGIKSSKEKEKLRKDFIDAYKPKQKKNIDQARVLKPIFDQVLKINDFSKFDFNDEEDMIVKFNMYGNDLNAAFTLRTFLESFLELGGDTLISKDDEVHIRAVAGTLETIKGVYDEMMYGAMNANSFLIDNDEMNQLSDRSAFDYNDRYQKIDRQDEALAQSVSTGNMVYKYMTQDVDKDGFKQFQGKNANEVFKANKELLEKKFKKK